MKHTLLCILLLGFGLSFTTPAVQASSASDTTATPAATELTTEAPADTLALPTAVEPATAATNGSETRLESFMESLDQRLEQVEQRLQRIEDTPWDQAPYFNPEYLMVLLITFISCTTFVLIVFLILKAVYRKRKMRYELERFAIEHGYYPENAGSGEMPLTRFLRRLLIVGIVGFGILAWVGCVNLSYMSFFSILLLWGLMGGVGYAVVYLFRLYVQRREENR